MIKLSPAREAELLADYKARVAAKEEANAMLDKMRADQKLKQEAFWAKMNKPVYVNHTEKDYKCAGCNATIPKGSRAIVKSHIVNVSGMGWNGQFLTEYHCAVCSDLIKKVEL
jgi:DNA-directed RNA polymerase subunit RPC12/RpoP